jgi:glycosyltransferase involved in cell wall biosynthesis
MRCQARHRLTAGGSRAALGAQLARYGLDVPSDVNPPIRLPALDVIGPRGEWSGEPTVNAPMRIAMVAPLAESVPPRLYGGTERVVSVLTEELVRRGHQVTLFASGDSTTSAELVACSPSGLRLDPSVTDYVAYTMTQMGIVYRHAGAFDLVHNHLDYMAFATARLSSTPTITTTHGRLDLPEVRRVYDDFHEQPLVAISNDQRAYLPRSAWFGTVSNAVDLAHYRFRPDAGDYLVFLGRISPEKRPDRAIEIARDVGMRLVMAAKIDAVDRDYYEHAIAPVIRANPSLIEFVGEVNEAEKDELLGGAWAYLFPIDWPEPFGLTMAEAMATGTPVIAYRAGSVPEVVEDGVTGFICETAAEMAAAVGRVGDLSRLACRERVERLFSPAAMADGYEAAYRDLLAVGARAAGVISLEEHAHTVARASVPLAAV